MQFQKDDIKEKILAAARETFLTQGFSKASMRGIAKNASVSTSNMYNYFKNKEELFYAIVDPVFHHLANLRKEVFEYKANKDFNNQNFMQQFTEFVPKVMFEMIKKYRNELLLIMDCSQGTKYEQLKKMMATTMENNFTENIISRKKKRLLRDSFLMHILSMNLIEGILEITRNYKNDEWAKNNIDSLMKYHIRGMVEFFT
ncbi:MAG: TetR/AcrR family transcriptional regulator [Deltaproteobacteria bacterium]|nr:TetR/AcrR family transcriptional regulator [Deltaproteobacteria bacterium]